MPFLAEKTIPIATKDILSWIFDEPDYDLDKPIYVDAANSSRTISCRQARVMVRKLVAGFHAAGLQKGDCVCVHSFNDICYSMLFLGIIAAGGVFAGTNPSYTATELIHHIKTSQTRYLITEPDMLENVLAAAKECHVPLTNIWIFNVLGQQIPAGFRSWEELMSHGEEDWVRFNDEKVSKETTAARLYSSGTTGLPKAAILSHYNFVAQHTLVHEANPKPWETTRPICLPMFHASIVPTAHTTTLKSGEVAFVMRRFELEPYLALVEKYQIMELNFVPPLVIALIMSPVTPKYSLRHVRQAGCGAAPLGKEPQKKLRDLLAPDAIFNQVWGMTETSCIATCFYHPESDDTGSVGRPIYNLDMKIIDDSGNDITAYDVRGELCVRGPTVFPGYFENPSANQSAFDHEGYFQTGDIAYCAASTRKWYIVDRKKELIKVRGFQVAPPELEAVLLGHAHIIDAAVIGVTMPGIQETECPRAYVVRRPGRAGAALTADEVRAWCRGRLARYKDITGGVVFVEAIPKNASGKILKRVLRDRAKMELGGGGDVARAKI